MKIISIVSIIIMCIFLASCTSSTPVTKEAKTVSLSKCYKINEPVELNGNTIQVTKIEKYQGTQFEKPKTGNEFIIITIQLTNKSDKSFYFNSFDFSLHTDKNETIYQSLRSFDNGTSFEYGAVNINSAITGTIVFETAINESKLILEYRPTFSDEIINIML
jgi:hypothetical protein